MKQFAGRVAVAALVFALAASALFAAGQTETASAERVTLKMFMGNSGLAHPVGVDPSDNWALNVIEEYANVDLEMEVPGYQDFSTKLQLLLASGNLPDIVHGWLTADLDKAADAGAFIDLKKYYDASAVMKDVVSPTAMEYAKSQPGGKYYGIPMVTMDMPAGRGVVIRYDILQAYNGGKFPTSVQGYVDFLKWVKATYPNSIPYAGRTSGDRLFINSAPFFLMHGTYPYGSRVQDGKYIRNIYLPEYRATVEVMRDLYASGVLDKDFVKCEAPQYFPKWQNTMVIWENGVDQILPPADGIRVSANDPNAVQMFIPPLTTYPSSLRDVKYTYWTANSPITGHRVAIASASKFQDQAWKVLEGFASPELRLAYEYGREGKEWNWSGGVRVPTDRIYSRDDNDADSHYWTLHLGIIQGFWPTNAKYAIQATRWGAQWDAIKSSADWVSAGTEIRGLPLRFPPFPEIAPKNGEAIAAESAILAKAITGEYSMVDFDNAVAEFKKNYGYFDETYTKYLSENKQTMLADGSKEAAW